MPSLAKGYVQSMLRLLPQLQKVIQAQEERRKRGETISEFPALQKAFGLTEAGVPWGTALEATDYVPPEEKTKREMIGDLAFLKDVYGGPQIIQQILHALTTPPETKQRMLGLTDTFPGLTEGRTAFGEEAPDVDIPLLKFIKDTFGQEGLKKQYPGFYPEEKEKTPKAPSAEEIKRLQFRQWKELGDIPGFERTPEQQLDFEYLDIVKGLGGKGEKTEPLKRVTGKEFLKLAVAAAKRGDEEKAKTYIEKAAGLERAEAEDIEHRFQTQEQLEQLEPGARIMPPGMMGEPGQVVSPMEAGGMDTPGFGAVTEEDEFIEEARGKENMINWDAVARKHPDWNLFYIKQKLGVNE